MKHEPVKLALTTTKSRNSKVEDFYNFMQSKTSLFVYHEMKLNFTVWREKSLTIWDAKRCQIMWIYKIKVLMAAMSETLWCREKSRGITKRAICDDAFFGAKSNEVSPVTAEKH